LRLLLDTHTLLWWSLDTRDLPAAAKRAIDDDGSEVSVSIASIWEIAIKFGLGKLPEAGGFVRDLQSGVALAGLRELPISRAHAIEAGMLSIPHKDPFDRLLIAQAKLEGLTIVSNEKVFDSYGVSRLWK
jgi:PIN domain nuclease of toxin-antitoxin system